jgi:hypothetical protein
MATSSLLKSGLHTAIAKGLYTEMQTKSAHYYYFLGKTLSWDDEADPPYPLESFKYDLATRNEIITMKEIKSTDVAFIVERYNWTSGLVWDQYDDFYCDQLDGINLISGGYGYADPPTVTITGGGATVNATAVATIANGTIVDITLTNPGRGYTSAPTVTLTGGGGETAEALALFNKPPSGAAKLEDCKYYAMTDEYNVYKCLNNNNNAKSTYKPVGTTVDPVTMPDGYMWKYLYSIPIALRNKFLTDTYIPVVTALRSQFYSNGNITSVKIDRRGQNYTTASISVVGDGNRESDPLFVTATNLTAGGSLYGSGANVAFSPPFAANAWADSITVLLGQKYIYSGNVYEVTTPGIFATPAPTHGSGIVSNGTAALKFIGSTATGTCTVVGGVVTAINLLGGVRELNITNSGSGYTTAPLITFTGGGGSGATAEAVMQGTGVSYIKVTNAGSGYTSIPSVVVGRAFAASTAYTVGTQIFYSNRLYNVTTAGTTHSSTVPTHTTGAVANGTATLTYAGLAATAAALLRYGSGYSTLPTITITPVSTGSGAAGYTSGVKSEAKLLPLIENGQITGVQIDDPGTGYSYANLTVSGDGTLAELSADLSPGDVNTLQANTELLTIDGRIMSCKVTSGGFGYASATVTIDGNGTGAAADAIVENGHVTKIVMTNYGQGYRQATVTITGNGYGAKGRAIITDIGGHGKDSIQGLHAKSLMFYTNISKDKNQGFEVNNDFRQVGIIKNPKKYGTTYTLDSNLASACWVVTGDISLINFTKDMLIRLSSNNKKFRIVNLTATAALLQALDDGVPTVGSVMQNENANSFSITGVTPPTADKYSGDLLFIDNKQAFTPTADQTVTLRTVIKF